jgi:hypothetical protein
MSNLVHSLDHNEALALVMALVGVVIPLIFTVWQRSLLKRDGGAGLTRGEELLQMQLAESLGVKRKQRGVELTAKAGWFTPGSFIVKASGVKGAAVKEVWVTSSGQTPSQYATESDIPASSPDTRPAGR